MPRPQLAADDRSLITRLHQLGVPIVTLAFTLLLLLLAVTAGAGPDVYQPTAEQGPHRVAIERIEIIDRDRADREVPLKIYLPADLDAPAPVVLFSHGLGGSREAGEYLGRFWASHGYASVHLQHPGSDQSVWEGVPVGRRMAAMRAAATSATVALNRAYDLPFVLDELERQNADAQSPLHHRLITDRVALAGHSFGAWSALVGGGQSVVGPSGRTMQVADQRVVAILPLSSPVPATPRQQQAAFATMRVPILHITGTLDDSPINNTSAADRRVPFDRTPAPDLGGPESYLIILKDADHMTFAGARRPGGNREAAQHDPKHHRHILATTRAFLDAYLRKDPAARRWLIEPEGLRLMLGGDATLEMKVLADQSPAVSPVPSDEDVAGEPPNTDASPNPSLAPPVGGM